MAGNTFEERLTRLEEQLKALQALTQGLAAWEMGGTAAPDRDMESTQGRSNDSSFAGHNEGLRPEPGDSRSRR